MALCAAELAEIETLLGAPNDPGQAVAGLRRRFPKLTITQCDPSDVDLETPFREWPRFSIYLVNSTNHCWRLTSDASSATGLVIVAHRVTS